MKARFCKSITYRFPIEKEVLSEFSDNGIHVESVVLLERMTGVEAEELG